VSDPPAGPATPDLPTEKPVLTVIWHGHRVLVFADGELGTIPRGMIHQHQEAMGDLAHEIGEADSASDLLARLMASRFAETHDVQLKVQDRGLQVWLRQRPKA
jgi:hypothetical protein